MQNERTYPTLSIAVAPSAAPAVRGAEVLAFSLLIGLSAQCAVRLPFTPVPVTGQTAMVLLAGALFGARRGAAAVALYLLEGAAGMPFFASGGAGLAFLLGPTGGYLLSFPVAAFVVGLLAERGWGRGYLRAALMMLAGTAVVYGMGLYGLARFVPPGKLLALGLYPFIPGDVAKIAFSATALPLAWRFLHRRS